MSDAGRGNPLEILTGEAVPDSRVRVEDVIAGGRARVRRRRGTVAGVCAALSWGRWGAWPWCTTGKKKPFA